MSLLDQRLKQYEEKKNKEQEKRKERFVEKLIHNMGKELYEEFLSKGQIKFTGANTLFLCIDGYLDIYIRDDYSTSKILEYQTVSLGYCRCYFDFDQVLTEAKKGFEIQQNQILNKIKKNGLIATIISFFKRNKND